MGWHSNLANLDLLPLPLLRKVFMQKRIVPVESEHFWDAHVGKLLGMSLERIAMAQPVNGTLGDGCLCNAQVERQPEPTPK